MGVKIYPSRVRQKANSMNQELETLKERMAVEKEAQSGLSKNAFMLMGFAWNSARNYVREVQTPLLEMTGLWIEAEMEGNKAYQAAAARLPQVDCLDEDQLKRSIQYWQREISYEESEEEPDYRLIRRLRGYISEAYAKLNAMSTFVSTTRGIYDKARGINRILNKAETELKNVHYNPETMTVEFTPVDPVWMLELDWIREMERAKAAGFTEEEIKELCEKKITVDAAITAWEEMQEQGISRSEIKDMEELGYSFARTIEVWKSLDGKEDKHFFACLILGGEEKCLEAFNIDPNDLSDNMTIAMAEYASRLLEHGKEEAFITLNNALLRSEKPFYYVMPDGTRSESLKTYRDIYLERMYAGTAVLLQGKTVELAAMEAEFHKTGKKPDGYEALNQKHMWEVNMCGYWATQNILVHRQSFDHVEDNQFQIESIIINETREGGIDYYMGYNSPWYGGWESVKVDNTIVNGLQMDDKWAFDELKKLEKARENLVANFVMKTVEGAATVAVSYAAPEVAILVTATLMIKNGAAGTVGGLDRLTSNELGKLTLKGGNVAAQNIINYAIQLNALESKINTAEYQILMTWFGKGSSYSMGGETGISFAGFYDPKALYALERLKTEGLGGMAGWNEDQIVLIKDAISKDSILEENEELRAVCEAMISGGYQLVDKEYKAKNISEFGAAIDNLDRIIANISDVSLPGAIHKDLFGY